MSVDKRSKKLIHLVAKYPDNYSSTLEDDLNTAHTQLPTVEHRRFSVNGKIYHGLRFEPYNDSFSLQFATSVPGESASTLPNAGVNSESIQLGQAEAPQGHDFSDGDIIALISKNNIFACPSVLRETTLAYFIREVFTHLGMIDAAKVAILHASNMDTLRIIRAEGISSIHTRTVLNAAAIARFQDASTGLFSRFINAMRHDDNNLLFRAAESNPNFVLAFSRSKFSKGANMDWAVDVAKEFIEEDIPYMIETGKGTKLTNTKMYVSKRVQLTKNGKSVFIDEALVELEGFKNVILPT